MEAFERVRQEKQPDETPGLLPLRDVPTRWNSKEAAITSKKGKIALEALMKSDPPSLELGQLVGLMKDRWSRGSDAWLQAEQVS